MQAQINKQFNVIMQYGKPVERQGRKAMGLKDCFDGYSTTARLHRLDMATWQFYVSEKGFRRESDSHNNGE